MSRLLLLCLSLWLALPVAFTDDERLWLRRLLWIEVRGMGEYREEAGLAVVDVVVNRVAWGVLGADMLSVLRWHSGETWQFPPYATYPCPDDRPSCPQAWYDYAIAYAWADEIVAAYEGGARSVCAGHLYYDSLPAGPSVCVLRAGNGQYIEYHDGWRDDD